MKRYKTVFSYEVRLGAPIFSNSVESLYMGQDFDIPVSHEDIEASWHECEPDIVNTACVASQGGDLVGFIDWGTDEHGKWVAEDGDSTCELDVRYGTVQYYVQETSWAYEASDETPEALYIDAKATASLESNHPVVVETQGPGVYDDVEGFITFEDGTPL